MSSYFECQTHKPWWVWLFCVGAVAGALAGSLAEEGPLEHRDLWIVAAVAILAFGLVWGLRLWIRLEGRELRWRLIPVWGGKLSLDDIREARVVAHRPLRRGGWGLRWMPGSGWSATLFTGGAVHFDLEGGRQFLLSSKRPEALAAALAEQGVPLGSAEPH
jgi:uncharacterized membrane protein YfcA